MTLPVPHYYMAFGAQPLDDLTTATWTDITPYVLAHPQTKMGAQHELSRTDAGTATRLLDNRDRRFDPTNTASPYYPNIRLGVPFREVQTWGGTDYVICTMYVDDWDLQWPGVQDAETMISCTDAFKALNMETLEGSRWKIEVRKDVSANIAAGHNTAWLRLDNASSSGVASDYGGQGWDGDYQQNPSLGLPSMIAGDTDTSFDCAHSADQRANLPYKNLLTGWPFTIEFVFRVWPARTESKVFVAAFDTVGPIAGGQAIQAIVQLDGTLVVTVANPWPTGTQSHTTLTIDDGVVHHCCIVMASATSLRIWIDGSDMTHVDASSTFSFPTNLLTGYAIGNTPAVIYGDYGLNGGSGVDAFDVPRQGGMQSIVFYDGLAMSSTRIQTHAAAAIVGWTGGGPVHSGSQVHALLSAVGWPAAMRQVEVGTSLVQNLNPEGSVLSFLQLLADTEAGRLFIDPSGNVAFNGRNHPITSTRGSTSQATFTDDGTGIPYLLPMDPHLDDLDWWTRASVARINGAPQIFDSIPANNSPRTLTKDGLLMTTDIEARAMAQYLVGTYETPIPRVRSISFEPADSPTLGWPAALGLGLGDRITVKRHPIGGGPAWVQDSIIEGITHTWPGGTSKWNTTYALSPVPGYKVFIIDSSLLDGPDVLFF